MTTQPDLFQGVIPLHPEALDEAVADLVERHGHAAVRYELDRHRPVNAVPAAPARHTDPETSHRAAKADRDVSRFSATSRQAKLLAVVGGRPSTDQEAAIRVVGIHAAPSAFDGCRRRMSDLRAAGYLLDSGFRRHNPGSDDDSIVWEITLAGEKALDSLNLIGWSRA